MALSLRPHHFLCLPGYKGYNYNSEQVNSWDIISKQLKENPDTDVMIIEGKDDLCSKCPNDGTGNATCNQKSINKLDEKVKELLGLVTGQVYKFSDILNKLKEIMTPEKHAELCGSCHWRAKGLCNDTFDRPKAPFMTITTKQDINPETIRYIQPKAA